MKRQCPAMRSLVLGVFVLAAACRHRADAPPALEHPEYLPARLTDVRRLLVDELGFSERTGRSAVLWVSTRFGHDSPLSTSAFDAKTGELIYQRAVGGSLNPFYAPVETFGEEPVASEQRKLRFEEPWGWPANVREQVSAAVMEQLYCSPTALRVDGAPVPLQSSSLAREGCGAPSVEPCPATLRLQVVPSTGLVLQLRLPLEPVPASHLLTGAHLFRTEADGTSRAATSGQAALYVVDDVDARACGALAARFPDGQQVELTFNEPLPPGTLAN